MGRLIDADRLQKQFNEKSTNPNYRVNMHNIKSIISNAPTVEAIPIPKGATNGDIIKALFPEVFVTNCKLVDKVGYFNFNAVWWNAPYKGEQR